MYTEEECLKGLNELLNKTQEAIIQKAVTEKINLETLIRYKCDSVKSLKDETKILKREASFNVLYNLVIELKLEDEYNKQLEWARYIKDRTTGRQ
tara:strand:- start:1332 stop:1616 length:285 start_codon:yes stop_codon:yes gene_type:complete